nr:MAG TPA: hypothetical protein [Caudoviricetes sp.]
MCLYTENTQEVFLRGCGLKKGYRKKVIFSGK